MLYNNGQKLKPVQPAPPSVIFPILLMMMAVYLKADSESGWSKIIIFILFRINVNGHNDRCDPKIQCDVFKHIACNRKHIPLKIECSHSLQTCVHSGAAKHKQKKAISSYALRTIIASSSSYSSCTENHTCLSSFWFGVFAFVSIFVFQSSSLCKLVYSNDTL